ncbi:hypothetical protein JCM8547_008099 [Rhodosporidiobolus lusitaniae]
MSSARIRPSLAELTADYDAPAFPELEQGAAPAVRVARARPPAVLSTSLPPPIPVVLPSQSSEPAPSLAPSKHKSRFALQREKEAAERAAAAQGGAERFELKLEDDEDQPWQPSSRPSLVKNILERPTTRTGPPQPPSAPGPPRPSPLAAKPTGFPASSRGLFPRKPFQPSATTPPPAPPSRASSPRYYPEIGVAHGKGDEADPESLDGLLSSVSKENEGVLSGMSETEILEEQRQIREELGLSEGVMKMLAVRGAKRAGGGEKAPARQAEDDEPALRTCPLPEGATPPGAPTRSQRELDAEAEEEGTPEYIRRHFFPNEPYNPALDWMRNAPAPPPTDISDTVTGLQLFSFDINGSRLSDSAAFEAAPHVHSAACGEHHVSSSTTFSIPSLLSLTSSSVPSQRSTAFNVLHRIYNNPSNNSFSFGQKEWDGFRLQFAQKAGWALRDPNLGVVGVSVSILADVLRDEAEKPALSSPARLPNEEEPATVLSDFLGTTSLPSLARHLSDAALPRPALLQILSILTSLVSLPRTSPFSPSTSGNLDLLFSTPKLLDSLVSRFIATPWPSSPPSSSSFKTVTPTPAALHLFTLLASSSRSRAKLLVERKYAEAPLRFVALPPWTLDDASPAQQQLGTDLLVSTLKLWTALGRYGLATGIRTQAAALLEGLEGRVVELARGKKEAEKWVAPFLRLLAVWMTAAVDPHVTGHDVLWSQVEGWRDLGAEAAEWALSLSSGSDELLAAAWGLLASWLEGSKVNRSWHGEEERKWVREGGVGKAFEEDGRAMRRLVDELERVAETGVKDAAEVAAAALRLSEAHVDLSEPVTGQLFELDGKLVERVVRAVVSRTTSTNESNAVALLLLPRIDLPDRLSLSLDLLPLLHAEDAVAARDFIDFVLRVAASPSSANLGPIAALHPSLELSSLAHLSTLRPFFTYAIVSSTGGRFLGPLYPTPRDIKLTACLSPFSSSDPILCPSWPLVALNELLRSAASPVFEQLPPGTEVSELQLVRSSLALMHLVASGTSSTAAKVSAPALVYDLIKVFMLEKDNGGIKGSSGAEAEVFRDEAVQQSMSSLLSSLSVSQQGEQPQLLLPDCRPSSLTIEGVSSLVSSAPFYQLYTDLVGLYDSISLSDRLFGLVLLPPLSMAYPVDYRRLLWTDYSHFLRNLRFEPGEVVSDKQGDGALSSFLEPREENEAMLAAYLDALVGGLVSREGTPFLHLVAVHHLAAAFFAEAEVEPLRKAAEKLATALVLRKAEGVLRTVLEYGQGREGEEVRMPPACYGVVDKVQRSVRVERLRKLVGKGREEKLDALVCL